MAAAFNGVRRTLTGSVDRAELTGRPSFAEEQINGKAIEVLAETGGDLDRLLELAERASKGDLALAKTWRLFVPRKSCSTTPTKRLRWPLLSTAVLLVPTPRRQPLASLLLQPMMRCA